MVAVFAIDFRCDDGKERGSFWGSCERGVRWEGGFRRRGVGGAGLEEGLSLLEGGGEDCRHIFLLGRCEQRVSAW